MKTLKADRPDAALPFEQAKLYLRTTEMSVAEIATSCGYESCEHFIRQFKKRVGVPPNGFRRTRA